MKSRVTDGLLGTNSAATRPGSEESETSDAVAQIGKQAKAAVGKLEHVIHTYPVASLATAAVVGVALGWWVKRSK